MTQAAIDAVFLPKLNRQESKADITTRVAREIMDTESAKREAKTDRLRLARLEMERGLVPAAPATRKSRSAKA